ncbi:MAG: gamma-glutamyltransferase [Terriglobia bacterium]|nr:MAG: gamma-glutamyltransferase [Terriglobia bacterium]
MRRWLPLFLSVVVCLPLSAAQPVRARHAMVVAQEPLATDVGVAVLQAGGNAVDAAVAVAFALAVTHPFAGNLGGGGFLLARFADGRSTFVDFREAAPRKASHDMYLDASGQPTRESLVGWRAAGVPGTVRGLELAHQKFGRLPWANLVRPSIDLASQGFVVSWALAESLKGSEGRLSLFADSKRIFLKDGAYFEAGDGFVQPELARTLERIAKGGATEFYEGETAHKLAAAMEASGGLITLEDLKNYRAIERKPLEGDYRDYHLILPPPPSAGGIGILQMLGMLDGTGYEKTGAGSAASLHYLAEVMRRFYADRNEFLGDPDFVKMPVRGLLDANYIRSRRATIDRERATPSEQVKHGSPGPAESSETTHFNVVDSQGNAVALTYTLNGGYGSGVTVPGLGFLLNNEMDDFAAKPGSPNAFGLVQGEANAIGPGKRPLSSMTPLIATRNGKLFLVAGAPGGPRITTAVMQVFLNVADFHMNVQEAVDFPRIHHQWLPDRLFVEKGVSPDTVALLKGMGYDVDYSPGVVIARVEAIASEDGWLSGGTDGRNYGKAAGY